MLSIGSLIHAHQCAANLPMPKAVDQIRIQRLQVRYYSDNQVIDLSIPRLIFPENHK
jgi:hypothetical protein